MASETTSGTSDATPLAPSSSTSAAPATAPGDQADGQAAGQVGEQVAAGAYDLLVGRLRAAATDLARRAGALNDARIEHFGSTQMRLIGSQRLRTASNALPRDLVAVGDLMLFGYNVLVGLKVNTQVSDVFSLHALTLPTTAPTAAPSDGLVDVAGDVLHELAEDDQRNVLADPRFVADFRDLYTYYRDASLLDLRLLDGKLLAAFRTGATLTGLKVFRWDVTTDGRARYLDNRGERDYPQVDRFDFEWTTAGREDYVGGRHPHINIADEVFLDPRRGTLEIKAEDGTATGRTVLSEPVEQREQDLADCSVRYARLGSLILLGVRPYREDTERFYVFNTVSEDVVRIDALGVTCRTLPEDHGIIFPGGFYLQDGSRKTFDLDAADMEFSERRLSPNGEDVLYVFHRRDEGAYLLLSYNLIRKEVATPIVCHGASVFDDGTMVVFREDPAGPSRIHGMQVWSSPFFSDTHADALTRARGAGSVYATIGNAELVRGISEALAVRRLVEQADPTMSTYESIVAACTRMRDAHHWLGDSTLHALAEPVEIVRATAELVLDEFEKVQAQRAQADREIDAARERVTTVLRDLTGVLPDADTHISGLAALRALQGALLTLRDVRYIDTSALEALTGQVTDAFSVLADSTVAFLSGRDAFASVWARVTALTATAEGVDKVSAAADVQAQITEVSAQLGVLSDVVSGLDVADSTVRTSILEQAATVLGALNRARALLDGRTATLRTAESGAAFAAEFALLSQSTSTALATAHTAEACDVALGRLMVTLENLETTFGDVPAHADAVTAKREETYEAFTSRKQALLDARAARATRLHDGAARLLDTVGRRAATLPDASAVQAFFASDPLVVKVTRSASDLRGLGETVKADELDAKIKAAKTEAVRALRDRTDMYESADVLRLGRHRFTVNTTPLQLTLAATGEHMDLLLTGTDYRVPVTDPAFTLTRPLWGQALVSETPQVYRGEYLAACLLADADAGRDGAPSRAQLAEALRTDTLGSLVTAQLAARYDEGYERGVHDADAAQILAAVLRLSSTAGLARFSSGSRALAQLFAAAHLHDAPTAWASALPGRARSALDLRDALGATAAMTALAEEVRQRVEQFTATQVPRQLTGLLGPAAAAADYLVAEIGDVRPGGTAYLRTAEASRLHQTLLARLRSEGRDGDLLALLDGLGLGPAALDLAAAWTSAFAATSELAPATAEVVAALVAPGLPRYDSAASLSSRVSGLLSSHPRIVDGQLTVRLDEFLARLHTHRSEVVPAFRGYQRARHELLERARVDLRLEEFTAQVMSGFVRNQLIDKVYLPLIGDNLAKQIGAAGDARRTDQMGLLLIISPPGYGKTTLMEYVTNRLGMVMVKVNGPALGHAVTSLDPAEAPDATSRREVERINFALQLANNVMLYLDDIQHTNPELLQKFISLADGTRRIEGVLAGQARTFDLRGKRFAVCMAGNPYTESGEKFVIPDMLANRADTYNLGEVLSGHDDLFALSYIENALTSNPVLAPLAGRDPGDIGLLVRMADGEPVEASALRHPYSALEISDIVAVLRRMRQVQQVLLEVNRAYIASAGQGEQYRTEPPFLLQGSYRNMTRLAGKIVPVMDDAELQSLLDDHYASESQTLTSGAEESLLKLAELRGTMTGEQRARWEQIKAAYVRHRDLGNGTDPAVRIAAAIDQVGARLAVLPSLSPAPWSARKDGQAGAGTVGQRAQALAVAAKELAASSGRLSRERLAGLADELQALAADVQR